MPSRFGVDARESDCVGTVRTSPIRECPTPRVGLNRTEDHGWEVALSTLVPGKARAVRDVMTPDPAILKDTDTIREAGLVMRASDVGDVLVTRAGGICGIVTDRDIVVRTVAEGRDPNRAMLCEICSRELVLIAPDESIERAVDLMRLNAVRRLPVMLEGKPVGIVSLGDLASHDDPDSVLAAISEAPGNI
jgi:CBS domain-containing protein